MLTLQAKGRNALIRQACKVVDRWRNEGLCSQDYIDRWQLLLRLLAHDLVISMTLELAAVGYCTPAKLALSWGDAMNIAHIFKLIQRAHALCGHCDFVIVGSLSVLGIEDEASIPSDMSIFCCQDWLHRPAKPLEARIVSEFIATLNKHA